MHHPALSLLSLQDRSLRARDDRELTTQRVMAGLGVAGTLSIAMLLAGMPLISMGIVALTSTLFAVRSRAVAAARAMRGAGLPSPDAIVGLDLRLSYRAILAGYAEIERSVAGARRLGSAIEPALERCMAAVELCGRMALLANPLDLHLEVHDPGALRVELERLRERCAATTDADAARVLGAAVVARARELANLEHIAATRARIHARLELCRAQLASFASTIVKLRVADEEQLAMAATSLGDLLDGVSDKLEILESVLAVEPEPARDVPASADRPPELAADDFAATG